MSKPTPAPAKSPDIIAPVEMTPDIASLVRATEDAQFGIIPTIAESRWLITGRAKSVPESASSPTKNTKALTNKVTTNTKRETLMVWWIADLTIPFSQWQSSLSHISSMLISSLPSFIIFIAMSIAKPMNIPTAHL